MTNLLTRPSSPETRAAQTQSVKNHYTASVAQNHSATAALNAHRELIEGHGVVPTFRVPISRTMVRVHGQCPYRAAPVRVFLIPDEPPSNRDTTIHCLLCSRPVARLEIGSDRKIAFTTCPCGAAKTVGNLCSTCHHKAKARQHMADWRARKAATP